MSDLGDLLASARKATPNDRITYRDPIVAHGAAAIAALQPWLSNRTLVSFAVVTIAAAGRTGPREAAAAALRSTPATMPPSVISQVELALDSLGEKGGLRRGVHAELRECLVEAARSGEFRTYTEAGAVAGLSMRNPHHRHTVIGEMLGAISEAEVLAKRPMLSSIVKAKGGGIHLGTGFTNLAVQLGLKPFDMDPDEFARAEAARTFSYWKAEAGTQ